MKTAIEAVVLLFLLTLSVAARPDPTNPYILTRPGSYHEYKVMPKATPYRDEVVENVALPGGRKGSRH